MSQESNLAKVLDTTIRRVVKRQLEALYRYHENSQQVEKKLIDMSPDDLRKALTKVRAMKPKDGQENPGKKFWEPKIILTLQIKTELDKTLLENPEYKKVDNILKEVEANLKDNDVTTVVEEVTVKNTEVTEPTFP